MFVFDLVTVSIFNNVYFQVAKSELGPQLRVHYEYI